MASSAMNCISSCADKDPVLWRRRHWNR
jgi:hypothetical protein